MPLDERDALFAHALALMVIGSHGRVELHGTPQQYFSAEGDGFVIAYHPTRPAARPMLLTIDAPSRVLEVEFASLTDEAPVVVKHVPGPWQRRLFKTAKPKLPWHDRTRWAAPWKRSRGWPFNHV